MRNKLDWFNDFYRFYDSYKDTMNKDALSLIKTIEELFPIDDFISIAKYIEILIIISFDPNDIKHNRLASNLQLHNQEIRDFHIGEKPKTVGRIIKPKKDKIDLTITNENLLSLI